MRRLLFLILFFLVSTIYQINAQDLFWVGGSGDWDNVSMWYKEAEGVNPAGIIPGPNSIVHFTDFSSTTSTWNVRLQPGSHEVHTILVETQDDFRLYFNGTSGNEVDLSVYGNIELLPSHRLEYASDNRLDNRWKFVGTGTQNITTRSQDLFHIEINKTGGIFNQLDDMTVSNYIRMFQGTWNSEGHDVYSESILFEDNEPSSSPLSKVFNAGTSTIVCDEWDSKFTYGSLEVTGAHTIRTSRFTGSPKQNNGPAFEFHTIELQELPDVPSGGVIIEYNNFECRSCIIENIIIEDTGETKFGDRFTVNDVFEVKNLGSSILFNGGNGRQSEVTFNGSIKTPKVINCDDPRTEFSAVHTDESLFLRESGTLGISDAIIIDIETESSGGADFHLHNGLLQGASSGWEVVDPAVSISYYWIGITNTAGDWNDPDNWITSNGTSNGCLPTLADDVFIYNESKGDIRIPTHYDAQCRHFTWTNEASFELILDGQVNFGSTLTVTGNFYLDESATITDVDRHEIYFNSTESNQIETNGVHLPEIYFKGNLGSWTLEENLVCDRFAMEAGTFNTNNYDLLTDYWTVYEEYPKHFIFGSSRIKVEGIMDLAPTVTRNVTVDPGTSLIECEELNSVVLELYDVQFNNPSTETLNSEYTFNALILNGTGDINIFDDVTLNHVVYKNGGSKLSIDPAHTLVVNESIQSVVNGGIPVYLKSNTSGIQAEVTKEDGNICVEGVVEFTDIDATLSGVFHAPDGVDNGNNSGINFDDGTSQTSILYWIGGTGAWKVHSNWSRVSGGCPSNINPNNSPNLIFDNNGINSDDEISISGNIICGKLNFYNSNQIILNIDSQLSPSEILVSGGYATFTGEILEVAESTEVDNSGFLISDINAFITKVLETHTGAFLARNGSYILIGQ